MSDRLKAFIEENFSEETLIIVSNREPYIHKKDGLGIKVETPAGGLTSAMDDVHKKCINDVPKGKDSQNGNVRETVK